MNQTRLFTSTGACSDTSHACSDPPNNVFVHLNPEEAHAKDKESLNLTHMSATCSGVVCKEYGLAKGRRDYNQGQELVGGPDGVEVFNICGYVFVWPYVLIIFTYVVVYNLHSTSK